jgi:hypothetical protein
LALIYTHQSSGKRKLPQTKRLQKAKDEHARFLASMGITAPKKRQKRLNNPDNMPVLTIAKNPVPLSNSIPGNGFKRSVDDYKWRKDRIESQEAIVEAERKKSRVAPAYNKGPVMYVTDADEPSSLGRKV